MTRHWSGAPPARTLDRTRHSLDRRPRPGDRQALRLELLGEQEGKLERLAGVEPGITLRLVALDEVVDSDVDGAADTLGHFLSRHLEMHAAGMSALGAMDGEEVLHLAQDGVEIAGLLAVGRGHGVAVHGIARPHDRAAGALHRAH